MAKSRPWQEVKNRKLKNVCKICFKTIFGSRYKLKCHMFTHNSIEARYKCKYCLKLFFRFDSYKSHINRHELNRNVNKKMFICDYCSRGYLLKNSLIKHLRCHDSTLVPEKFKFYCTVCGIKFCEDRLLIHHIRKHHFNFNYKESVHEKKLLNETWVEKVGHTDAYVEMTKIAHNILAIKRCNNTKKEIDEKGKCQNTEPDDYQYCHINNAQYSKVECNYCGKYMLKRSLIKHIREMHNKKQMFYCDSCKCGFNRRYQLVNHECGKFKNRTRRI